MCRKSSGFNSNAESSQFTEFYHADSIRENNTESPVYFRRTQPCFPSGILENPTAFDPRADVPQSDHTITTIRDKKAIYL